jgi:hypothetical protein
MGAPGPDKEGSMKVRLILAAAIAAALALVVAGAGFSAGARTPTITGMVGGDFDTQLPGGSPVGADWGVDASLPRAANNVIHDGDVRSSAPEAATRARASGAEAR